MHGKQEMSAVDGYFLLNLPLIGVVDAQRRSHPERAIDSNHAFCDSDLGLNKFVLFGEISWIQICICPEFSSEHVCC
jgi:hypothetical protein